MELLPRTPPFTDRLDDKLQSFSVAERLDTDKLSPEVERLALLERGVPVTIGVDTSLRPKILDSCGMSCIFCHNEGTPVAAAYKGEIGLPDPAYRGGRVSVFEKSNGVDFLPGTMQPNQAFEDSLRLISQSIGSTEVHFTGGEPTLHKNLPGLIRSAKRAGYAVKMTSNGENGAAVIRDCAAAGLDKINFSIFGTTPDELAAVQDAKYNNPKLAAVKLDSLHRSIETALDSHVKVDINIVMSDFSHAERVARIIDRYDNRVSVRILNDLDAGDASYVAIYELLAQLGAVPDELYVQAGSSNSRVKYRLPDGQVIYFKQIRRAILPDTCGQCSLNNDDDCKEGYYGVRMYIDDHHNYKVGVCMQRMDLTVDLDEFLIGSVSQEVVRMRQTEYSLLADHYKDRIKE